ncbi:MAG: hypothetical protein KKD77_20785 [Gammaproteobacteria bacterium]|nr:hypothetical protein [Gammaproteobacteria bacterium]
MPAGYYSFIMEQGADFIRDITYKDSAGALVNVTNYTARMDIRSSLSSSTSLISLTTENSRILVTGVSGLFTWTLTAAETMALNFNSGVYDFEIIDPFGEVERLLQGKVTLSKEVTR